MSHLMRLFPEQTVLVLISAWSTVVFSIATAVTLLKVAFLVLELPEENERLGDTIKSMVEARGRAEEAYDTLTSFLSFICHEIRNPLHSMRGLVSMLKDGEEECSCGMTAGAEVEDRTDSRPDLYLGIETSCAVMSAVLDDSLDFSKLQAGQMSVESLPFELGRVIDTVSSSFRGRAAQGGTRLVVDVDAEISYGMASKVVGDPVRLAQVITNLVSNAIKFTPNGTVTVSACELPVPPADSGMRHADCVWLDLTVRDTGIGIAKETLPLLFRPFSQANVSTSRKYGGTGLGLAIVHRIVGILGGRVTLDSIEGRGTTARVIVPFTATSRAQHPSSTSAVASKMNATLHVPSVTVDVLAARRHGRSSESKHDDEYSQGSGGGGVSAADDEDFGGGGGGGESSPLLSSKSWERGSSSTPAAAAVAVTKGSVDFTDGANALPNRAVGGGGGENMAERLRVLVVDDDKLVLKVNQYIFSRAGCAVQTARSGEEAVNIVREAGPASFDLFVCDLMMPPGQDGFETMRQVRSLGYSGPAIACTGGSGSHSTDRTKTRDAGFSDLLHKPIDSAALLSKLRRICEASGRSCMPRKKRLSK